MRFCKRCDQTLDDANFYRGQTNCKLCMKANAYKWRAENPHRYAQLHAGWSSVNKERIATNSKRYRAIPDRQIAQRIHNLTRLRRVRNASGNYGVKDIRALMIAQAGLCPHCRCSLADTGYHIDHKIPISRGGSNWPVNLQLLCPPCNIKKGDKYSELPLLFQVEGP